MANQVYAVLTVTGPEDQLQRFQEVARSETRNEPLDLQNFIPMPAMIKETPNSTARQDWTNQHWGSQSNVYNVNIIRKNNSVIQYEFQTKWDPINRDALKKIAWLHPQLTLFMRYGDFDTSGYIKVSEAGKSTQWEFANDSRFALRPDRELAITNDYTYQTRPHDHHPIYNAPMHEGQCAEFPLLSVFGHTPEQADEFIRNAVKAAVSDMIDADEQPPNPYPKQ